MRERERIIRLNVCFAFEHWMLVLRSPLFVLMTLVDDRWNERRSLLNNFNCLRAIFEFLLVHILTGLYSFSEFSLV